MVGVPFSDGLSKFQIFFVLHLVKVFPGLRIVKAVVLGFPLREGKRLKIF